MVDVEAAAKRSQQARPVNPQEAAKGKLDYVQVKDWGSGNPDDFGDLQVESVSQQQPELATDHSRPFYEQLARRLEQLQVTNHF